MKTTHVPRAWNPQAGDRVRFRQSRLVARGTIVELLTPEQLVVKWDGLETSSVQDRSILEPAPVQASVRAG
ncbi:MAG TPA: hypothetical protein VMF64_10540 [Steroidobacteraceae bacterium]|nr:hypothetical protein [Steroidobacteraceae bacterium]